MPIRAEYRAAGLYGRDWRAYRARLLELRGARCAVCGRDVPKYLNLAHTTHDPLTSSVKFLCAGCHTRADSRHRVAVIRRRRAVAAGQLWLWDEGAARARAVQGKLFGC
jgi:hypothetical protein